MLAIRGRGYLHKHNGRTTKSRSSEHIRSWTRSPKKAFQEAKSNRRSALPLSRGSNSVSRSSSSSSSLGSSISGFAISSASSLAFRVEHRVPVALGPLVQQLVEGSVLLHRALSLGRNCSW